ncbi:hypothetical protein BKK40_26295 [Bacillus cereus]|nr:hypothetical protein BKK40_26295 [Bacillus cereus]
MFPYGFQASQIRLKKTAATYKVQTIFRDFCFNTVKTRVNQSINIMLNINSNKNINIEGD